MNSSKNSCVPAFLIHSSWLPGFQIHFCFLLWMTSLLPSGSRNCAIQQTGVSVFSISNVTPRSFSFAIAASISSTSNATVVPSRDGTTVAFEVDEDRKSTRLNSSHVSISYAVFCLKKKKYNRSHIIPTQILPLRTTHPI